MSFRVVRQSKFRHVFGQPYKKEQCYDNIRITKISWDSTFCAVNPKYLAVITEAAGGGAFLVLPLEKTGRLERDQPIVGGHKGPVLDIAWCPHNDDIIASSSEDCTVKIWEIPEGGLVRNLETPLVDLVAHQRKCGIVLWHPTAQNIILSAGADCKIFIWDAGSGEPLVEIAGLSDIPLCAAWNRDGSKVATTSKDKMLRVFEARTGELLHEKAGHVGSKPQQITFLKDDKLFTTGFSRMSERQYALRNPDLSEIVCSDIDNSNGVLLIFYDPDTDIIFLCGKGDNIVRYFEITDEAPYVHYLSQAQSSEPQRGIGWMPKRGVNVNNCEIARLYKLYTKGFCEVIPMVVPRKSDLYQDDLYPDTASPVPSVTADEWFNGANAPPILMTMRDFFKSTGKGTAPTVRKSNVLSKPLTRPAGSTTASATPPTEQARPVSQVVTPAQAPQQEAVSTPAAQAAQAQPTPQANSENSIPAGVDFQNVLDDIRKLKIIVKGHERRIKYLEDKLAVYESQNDDGQI